MRARASTLAWGSLAATLALLTVQTYYVLASGTPLRSADAGLNSFPVITLGTALGAVVGAVVASRHPRNRVGWLFCAGQLGTAIGLVAEAFSTAVALHGQPGPRSLLESSVVASYSFGAVWALTLVSAIFLVVPDGLLPSRRWRPVAVALPVPFVVSSVVLVAYAASHVLHVHQDQAGIAWYFVLPLSLSWLLLALTLLATTTSLVLRLRRAEGVLRQQLRWLATAATFLLIGTVLAVASPDHPSVGPPSWVYFIPLYLAYVSVPVAAGVAVLRYRLYDIDVVISRAVLLGLLLGFVTTGYVAVVVGLARVFGDRVDASFGVSLLVTAAVAMAFQPLRSRAVRVADRLAFGRRAVPYEALAELSRMLGESPDPSGLLPAVAQSAARAVQARRATVRLYVDSGPAQEASWPGKPVPASAGSRLELPVTDRGDHLGVITLEMPPGRALRDRDVRLVSDLADQASIAFRNARLAVELSARVDELNRRTLDLVESRRRLITAGDAERRRLERAIAREVATHLQALPERLARLAGPSQPHRSVELAQLAESSNAALEALREITRGVFPAQLVRSGLEHALRSYLGRPASQGRLVVRESAAHRRFPPPVEAAAFFCVAEAARDLLPPIEVVLDVVDDELVLEVRGRPRGAMAISHIRDRVEAVGGTVLQELLGDGTVLDVHLPTVGHDRPQTVVERVAGVAPPRTPPRAADVVQSGA